jgi:oxaloacetate decarboxylase alpha subunit
MEEVRIVDTTLRDGDISLWAYGMTTGMMLPALRHMDEAGFDSMEFFLSLRFKKFVREHKEDPWDWLRLGTKEIKKTRLRYHGAHSGNLSPNASGGNSTVAKYDIDLAHIQRVE